MPEDNLPEMERSLPSDVPVPTAEAELLCVFVEAWLSMRSKDEAMRFLKLAAEILAEREAMAAVVPIRPSPSQAAQDRASRRAVALFRRFLPALLARKGADGDDI